jgi:hypothetical protein
MISHRQDIVLEHYNCRALWCAVIATAAEHAMHPGSSYYHRRRREKALGWINKSAYFDFTCRLIEVDPDNIRRKIKQGVNAKSIRVSANSGDLRDNGADILADE